MVQGAEIASSKKCYPCLPHDLTCTRIPFTNRLYIVFHHIPVRRYLFKAYFFLSKQRL